LQGQRIWFFFPCSEPTLENVVLESRGNQE
jgi:hypothetical protein